jgi:hypothetical protein
MTVSPQQSGVLLRTRLLTLIVSVGLSACATSYQSYSGGGAAQLIVQNKMNNYANLLTFKDPDQCQQQQFVNIGSGKSYQQNTLEAQNSAKITIQPDQKFSIGFSSSFPTDNPNQFKYCVIAGIFTPEKDGTYVANFQDTGDSCRILITRQRQQSNGNIIQEPVRYRVVRYRPSTFTSPSMCTEY